MTISIIHKPVQHDWTKHLEVDKHFIKQKIVLGVICTPYVTVHNQLVDVLTSFEQESP